MILKQKTLLLSCILTLSFIGVHAADDADDADIDLDRPMQTPPPAPRPAIPPQMQRNLQHAPPYNQANPVLLQRVLFPRVLFPYEAENTSVCSDDSFDEIDNIEEWLQHGFNDE